MKSPIRYPGGKSQDFLKFCDSRYPQLFPLFKEYREPFLGGGSVFLYFKSRLGDSVDYWVNDKFEVVFNFWYALKSYNKDLVKGIKVIKEKYTDRDLDSVCRKLTQDKDPRVQAVAYYILNRITFGGGGLRTSYSDYQYKHAFKDEFIDSLVDYKDVFKDVKLTNLDYSELFEDCGEGVLMFLDPPYYRVTDSDLYGKGEDEFHNKFDFERYFQLLYNLKCNWIMTIDNHDYIREKVKDYSVIEWDAQKLNFHGNKENNKEIIVKNY